MVNIVSSAATYFEHFSILKLLIFNLVCHCISDESDTYGGVPEIIFHLTELRNLNLAFQGLRKITEHFSVLNRLVHLNLSDNPVLESIVGEVGTLPLKCRFCERYKGWLFRNKNNL